MDSNANLTNNFSQSTEPVRVPISNLPADQNSSSVLNVQGTSVQNNQGQTGISSPTIQSQNPVNQVELGSQVAVCSKCNKQFKIIKQEIEFLQRKGLSLPGMCPNCREARRQALRNPRQLIKSKCDKCGKELITTPKVDPNIKVYCDVCFKDYLNTTDPIIR